VDKKKRYVALTKLEIRTFFVCGLTRGEFLVVVVGWVIVPSVQAPALPRLGHC